MSAATTGGSYRQLSVTSTSLRFTVKGLGLTAVLLTLPGPQRLLSYELQSTLHRSTGQGSLLGNRLETILNYHRATNVRS